MTVDAVSDADTEPWLVVRSTAYGGRGYFAARDIPAGTCVLHCKAPLMSVVFKPFKKEVCAYCYSYDGGKTRKIKLEVPKGKKSDPRAYAGLHFCSVECRDTWVLEEDADGTMSSALEAVEAAYSRVAKDAPSESDDSKPCLPDVIDAVWADAENSPVDKLTHLWLDDVDYDTARMVTVLLVRRVRKDAGREENTPGEWAAFQNLQSNEQQHIEQYPEVLHSLVRVYRFLRTILSTELAQLCTPSLIRDASGRDAGNAFGIWEQPTMMESECFGTAVFPLASFFNHSCRPTVSKQREGRGMVFTTATDIQRGDELFISYGMMQDLAYSERSQILKQQWHFSCQCPRCVEEAEL